MSAMGPSLVAATVEAKHSSKNDRLVWTDLPLAFNLEEVFDC